LIEIFEVEIIIYPKFQLPVKYREMQGKRVNIIDNEIFENLP